MDRHYCKQCGRAFNYCSSCALKKIPHKAAGFCSKECSAAFKAPKIEIPEVVEVATPEIVPVEVENFIENDTSEEVEVEMMEYTSSY